MVWELTAMGYKPSKKHITIKKNGHGIHDNVLLDASIDIFVRANDKIFL